MTGAEVILALNVGSSSLKFCVAKAAGEAPLLSGVADRVGSDHAGLTVVPAQGTKRTTQLGTCDHSGALSSIAEIIAVELPGKEVAGIGHRIVHGGQDYTLPVVITSDVLEDLEHLAVLAPLHQPHGLRGVRAAQTLYPKATQVACFDTAFHAGKPWLHNAFALPRAHYDQGLRRYGFHGLSCQSVIRGLNRVGFPVTERRFVIAHLGNGCSVTAVLGGQGVACSMGFSTLDGLTMGTRCGRIDPGALLHLLRSGMSLEELEDLLYRQSGLLGLSAISNDMRDLEASDADSAGEAIDFFVARLVEEVCRMAGVLGGLDTIVFCGGIGENASAIRERVRQGVAFLPGRDGSGVDIRVQRTDEEAEIIYAVEAMAQSPA